MKIIFIFLLCIFNYCYAETIRVAIFDNPPPKWTSEKYQKYYLNGVNVEVNKAHILNIHYKIEVFPYKEPTISIYSVINAIKKWKPDIIIGPRVSENFLLLKNQFDNILVLSPYASASDVYNMSKNFYTLAVSADFSGTKMSKYIQSTFKPKTVYIFTDAACRSCIDFDKSIQNSFVNTTIKVKSIKFIDENILNDQIKYKEIFNGFRVSDVVILNCTGYGAGLLIAQISNNLGLHNINYLGGDSWGTYKDWSIAKVETDFKYHAYRITPKVVNTNDKLIKKFSEAYKRTYNQEEPDAISYVTYNTLNSVTDALLNYNCKLKNVRANILCSYQKAIAQEAQWHRPIIHEVFEMKKDDEYFLQDIY